MNDFTYSLGKRRPNAIPPDILHQQFEQNLIDVLPFNFSLRDCGRFQSQRASVCRPMSENCARMGLSSTSSGVGFSFNGNFIRAFSSSASQFAYNVAISMRRR